MRKYIKLAVGMIFTVFFLFLSYKSIGSLDFKELVAYPIRYYWLIAAVFFFVIAQWFRSLAWSRAFNIGLGTDDAFRGILISTAANMVLPFRMGEAVRIAILGGKKKNRQVYGENAYYKAGVSLILERVIDLLILVIIAVISVFFIDFSASVKGKIELLRDIILIAGITIIFLVALFYLFRYYIMKKSQLAVKLQRRINTLGVAFNSYMVLKAGAYIVLSWSSVYISTIFGILSVGIEMIDIFSIALVVLVMTNLAILLPAAPGGIGIFQYACIYSLSLWGICGAQAGVFSVLLHLAQYIAVLPLGLVFFVFWGRKWLNIRTRI